MSVNGPPALSVIKARMQTLNKNIDILKDEIIIQDKIINYEVEKRSAVEAELLELTTKIKNVEAEKHKFEQKFVEANNTLELINRDSYKNERYRKVMENRQNADNDRIDQLEQQISSSLVSTEATNKRCEELQKKLILSEHLSEQAQIRSANSESRIKVLESDLKSIVTKFKLLEIERDQAADKEHNYSKGIRCLSMQVKEAEDRALSAEREVTRREQEINTLKDQMERERTNYSYIKKELDTLHDGYFGI